MERAGQLVLAFAEQAVEEGRLDRDSAVALKVAIERAELRLGLKAPLTRLVELETARLPESYAFLGLAA
jgi:hypothetical protein